MNSPVTKIKESLPIEEVIASYIKLEPAGSNFKARCPFHNEKTPSFFVSPGRGNYYCFGCGASGDIFTFVEEFEGLDFKGALKLLAQRAGVTIERFNSAEERKSQSEKDRLHEIMEEATQYFEKNLNKNNQVTSYLKGRGLNDESIKSFRIGFIPEAWRELYTELTHKGYKEQEIEKAGLIKKTEKGYYDRFRNRVMFPISDSSGRVIAFSGRLFTDDGKSAKYLNSPDTPIFNKSAVLFGLDKAKDSIRKNNFSILVEGQMDLVLSHQAGFKNTIATSGTALSDATVSRENVVSNLGLVRRLSPNIVLAFDGDKAGFNASLRAGKIALALGMDVKVANMPAGVDPADLISKNGVDTWREAIRGSKHLIEFMLIKVLGEASGDIRKVGRHIKETILPFVASLESAIEQTHFLKKISDASTIPEQALKDDLKKIAQETNAEKKEIDEINNTGGQVFRKDYIERKLLGIIFWQKSAQEASIDIKKTIDDLSKILNSSESDILKKNENQKEDLIFEAEVFYGHSTDSGSSRDSADLKKDVRELLLNLEEEYLHEERVKKMQELHIHEEKKNIEKVRETLQAINEINSKIQNIKNSRI